MPPTPYTPLLPQRPLPPPDTSPWNECQALSQQLKRFSLLRPNSLCILSGWSGIFCLAFCCFCFQLFWWQLGTRQAFSLVLHFFFFFLCGLYLPTHAHFQLVLSYYAAVCLAVKSQNLFFFYVVDFEFCFNNLYNWMFFFSLHPQRQFSCLTIIPALTLPSVLLCMQASYCSQWCLFFYSTHSSTAVSLFVSVRHVALA